MNIQPRKSELFKNLIENEKNYYNFNSLISLFKENYKTFIPFLGAGTSKPRGEPDWDQWLRKIIEKLDIKKIDLNIEKKKNSNPKIFSLIYERSEKTKSEFFRLIFNEISAPTCRSTDIHCKLMDIFNLFVTTNYISPIEDLFEEKRNKETNKQYSSSLFVTDIVSAKQTEDYEIIYLHGHKKINFGIILEEDYKYFYPTISKENGANIIEDFLKKFYATTNIVFIGFSFMDTYVLDYFLYLNKNSNEKKKHFWLIDPSNQYYQNLKKIDKSGAKFYEYFEKHLNIYPIVYRENFHEFCGDLFFELNKIKENQLNVQLNVDNEFINLDSSKIGKEIK